MNKSTLFFVLLGAAVAPLAIVACDDDDGDPGDLTGTGSDAGPTPTPTTTATTGDGGGTTPPDTTTKEDGGAVSEDGGSDGGNGDKDKLCDELCTEVQATCVDKNEQYDDKDDCLKACENYPVGSADAKSGNSIYCRLYHVGIAAMKDMATAHCPHTSEKGGGVCED